MSLTDIIKNPSDDFTPIPFWFWNDKLSEEEIERQMLQFKDKGVNGFVIHPRKGLPKEIPYLSEDYFHFVRFAVELAAKNNMQVVLYDEAMYPSGSCHGKVVAETPGFASMGLAMVSQNSQVAAPGKTSAKAACGETSMKAASEKTYATAACGETSMKAASGETSAKTASGGISAASCIPVASWDGYDFVLMPTGGTIRGVHPGEDDGEPDAPKSADLLNPEAVKSFIRNTHDLYYAHLKEYFGTVIKAFFTDEPAVMGRNPAPGLIPWSSGIYEEYLAAGGKKENLRFLFEPTEEKGLTEGLEPGSLPGGSKAGEKQSERSRKVTARQEQGKVASNIAAETRAIYRRVIHQRLSQAYYKPLHDWCEDHGIALTGHPEKSTDIGYLQYFHIPSQDVVWRFVAPEESKAITGEHSCMAKCSSDSARHRGKIRNGNECFGVCSRPETPYSFTQDEMRWYLNWLFVRGVNMIFPHAFFYSIRGDRKDERPPDVGLHCGFWDNYKQMTDFIKRTCTLLTGSSNLAEIAVLCTSDNLSWRIAKPLFENQVEFNYLEEELLPLCVMEKGRLKIQKQDYKFLIYERSETFKPETKKLMKELSEKGLCLIPFEDEESLIQELLTPKAATKINRVFLTETTETEAQQENVPEPMLRVTLCRKEGEYFALLVNEGFEPIKSKLQIKGFKALSFYDAFTGERSSEYKGLKANQCLIAVLEKL
ncbi:MAG: hypothetical protein K5930_11520 [Treponemataceae bacterium]|nr:hypothetical protein [Treponemataceae bacterium]